MSTQKTVRDEFAETAPVDFDMVASVWGSDPDLADDRTRAGFFAVWALMRYEYADALLAEREEE